MCVRNRGGLAALCLVIGLLLVPGRPRAEEARAGSGWSFQVVPFLWLPEIQGHVSARDRSAAIDVDFGDLFDLMGDGELFATGGHFEARYERLSLFLDAFGGTARPTTNITVGPRQGISGTGEVTMNFAFVEFGPAYRVWEYPTSLGRPIWIDALVGGRFMYFYESLTLRGGEGAFLRSVNDTSEWVDPFVGGRFSVPLAGDLDLVFRGDIGGFGAGSQLAWNLIGGFQYGLPWKPFGARTSLVAVYKALDFDYESGSSPGETVAALDLRGPALGLAFDF
jgi:hypothetical protein